MLETQIDDHRNPKIKFEPESDDEPRTKKRTHLNEKTLKEINLMFNDFWYDFDEEKGTVDRKKYRKVMNKVKEYKKIKSDEEFGPFSPDNLERLFVEEDEKLYENEVAKKRDGIISHRSVVYICHDIIEENRERKAAKFKRNVEFKQKQAEIASLQAHNRKLEQEEHHRRYMMGLD